jgi:peptide deformylase
MILEIKQFGDEILRTPCKEVDKKDLKSKEFKRFIKDLIETMYRSNGVGLAAPQVGTDKRVIVIDTTWTAKNDYNPMVLINPKIVYSEGELLSEEGCLSFKGSTKEKTGVLLNNVKRFRKVKVNFVDLDNKKQSIEADGDLLSRCLQHEIDHLDGILFIDRDENMQEVAEQLSKNGFPDSDKIKSN